ncbi:hypothetical protein AB6C87_09280, partial [Vibrio splendidus]
TLELQTLTSRPVGSWGGYIGFFELAMCNYKKSDTDSTDLLEIIDLLDNFKEQALRQSKYFYETREAINISLSYVLVSKHFLVSSDSL